MMHRRAEFMKNAPNGAFLGQKEPKIPKIAPKMPLFPQNKAKRARNERFLGDGRAFKKHQILAK